MSFHAVLRNGVKSIFLRFEEALDTPFGGDDNPLRHLGAFGLYLLWIVVGSGLYLYAVLDTGIDAVYRSIGEISSEQWYLGGILRSLHRYASDGFMLVMLLHLIREWCYGRYHGFRRYSWLTGVPLLWLAYLAGIGGYWIVWDQLAQWSATATTELLDWLPIFSEPSARNFMAPDSINDRFFTMLVFLHLGVPLLLILGLWAHVHRISHVDYLPSRRAMLATLATLLVLSLLKPALSHPPANLAKVPGAIGLDWFILFIHPLTDLSSPALIWTLLFGLTALLFALPFLPRLRPQPVAVVDATSCTGCDRCLADCPYAAISMAPHPRRPGLQLAVVDADLCAACGICAGACPSSTPFRRQEALTTGIDMPQQPVNALREQLEQALAQCSGRCKIVVFSCTRGADASALAAADTAVIPLLCTGMLPPAFVEYALRGGADGVFVSTCRHGGCD
ncbi:MAG TPA: cytochrome b N-terminal domain-containing protein, partial [Accumulibacter sp.]|nr:cytochrome b N-terminal domain-containing protein [Accumulibacter sp.]